MGTDDEYSRHKSRRRQYGEEDYERESKNRDRDKRKRSRERDSERYRERRRSRDRNERQPSRTPDSKRRRSRSRSREREEERYRKRSPDGKDSNRRKYRVRGSDERDEREESRRSPIKRSGPLPSQDDSFALVLGESPEKPKEKPNFGNTGLLAAASNSVAQADGTTITLKYHEPPEARKPPARDRWRLFVFKGKDIIDEVDISARSCWLVGRDMAVVDLPAEHSSVSKQHAVIQFRYTEKRNEYGDKVGKVKPYLIDLESANGTVLNNEKVPESRYMELRDKDMIQFGHSTREYVLMLERD